MMSWFVRSVSKMTGNKLFNCWLTEWSLELSYANIVAAALTIQITSSRHNYDCSIIIYTKGRPWGLYTTIYTQSFVFINMKYYYTGWPNTSKMMQSCISDGTTSRYKSQQENLSSSRKVLTQLNDMSSASTVSAPFHWLSMLLRHT